ncbi:MAG TPA: DUF1223 domain-containing protein [Roseiarcus sp.]|nr:DUF1223 domain-containing protein [Roseiarcus sp.]
MRIALGVAFALLAAPALAADAGRPAVIELFQSQGCSSCPPANAALVRYADRADWLALTFAVTYWDRLGWRDTFGRPEFTQRQYAYARSLGEASVYTPEVVVNGRAAGVGDDVAEVEALATKADRGASGPSVTLGGGSVAIGAGSAPGGAADVWLALYDPRVLEVAVGRGENAGRTLPHRNVVKRLLRVGTWDGAAETLALPPAGGLARAVLVQKRGAGAIIAAGRG